MFRLPLMVPSIAVPFERWSCSGELGRGLRSWSSVLVCQCAADVQGGEEGEDVGLQQLHEALEEREDDAAEDRHGAGHDADDVAAALVVEKEVLAPQHEQQ